MKEDNQGKKDNNENHYFDYFGIKTSPINNIGRSISPNTHSPIL